MLRCGEFELLAVFCREISFVASYMHLGGSQKVTSDDEGEGGGGGGTTPQN